MTDDLRFDELLREDAAALPPPAAGEINPWSMAMTRVLWGLGLITITLNFLYLDVILPAVGGLLLVLGFCTLRRENTPLRWCYILSLASLAVRGACIVLAALPVETGLAPAYVNIALLQVLYVCLWRGMVGVSRAAGEEKPAATAAGAMAVFYAVLTVLALIGVEGWLLVLPLLVLYILLLRSMVRLSRSLADTGYAITAAPVRLPDAAVLWGGLGVLLAAVLLALSYRRGGLGLAIPLGAALLVLNPISTALCLQYTDVYLLTLVFGILLLWRRTDGQKFGCLLYLWLGIGVGFFDFLTYPVASLGILLAIELTVSTSGLWKKIQAMLLNSTAWALGYGGMWAGKWVVASAFTDQNVILDALRNISGRTSSTAGEETVDIFSVLWRNAQTYVNVQTLFLLLVLGALLGYLVMVKKFRLRLSASTLVPLVLCALYPVAWYAVLRNHSMIHAYMTHRDLAVTVMALGCMLSSSLQKPSPAGKVDRA